MRDEAELSLPPVGKDHLPAGTRIGDYVVEDILGEGGMATVYVGRHPVIGRRVAIKVIRANLCRSLEAVERFIQEARAANEIGHPNIVDVFTFGTLADGRCYFVMEWLKGRTLADVLDNDGPMSWRDAAHTLIQICDGLEAAHRVGIVHRDLKPQNIFFVDRFVKLLDFGIAKLINRPEGRTTHTQPGLTMGTPDYISPEQARGRVVDGAADIYSLGVLAFEMVTSQLPFLADNAADMMAMHLNAQPRTPSSVMRTIPAAYDAIVARMMKKDATERPSPTEVRAALEALLAVPAPAPRPSSHGGLLLGGFLAVVAAVMVAGERESIPLTHALVGLVGTAPLVPPVPLVAAPAAEPPQLEAAGEIVVKPRPRGARVRIDGEEVSIDGGVARLVLGKAGTHSVAVTAPGHAPMRLDVTVESGRSVVVPVALVRTAPPVTGTPRARLATSKDDFHVVDPWKN